ncbi:MAG: HU family DNA-binding protein [Gammaproteobacteria bacterium]|nr:HU family DNA-binding protein [Gammaproteobacteria bacterium]
MAAKKPAKKKVVKAVKSSSAKKTSAIGKAYNKSEMYNEICDVTELTRKQVASVFEHMTCLIERHLKKGGVGVFIMPGLFKCQVVHKPATKARKGVNPFTGEEMMFKAKPARNVVKVRALKKMKEMA